MRLPSIKMLNRELIDLRVFPAYEPEETFTVPLTQSEDVEKAVLEYGHLTVVDLGHFGEVDDWCDFRP